MKFSRFSAFASSALAFAASMALAGPAAATIHNITYKGVVTSAFDPSGEFGVGASLLGQAFTAKVIYDDAKAGAFNIGGEYYDTYRGVGAANPVTVTAFLNGFARSFGATSGQDSREDRALWTNCISDCTDANFQQNAEDRYTQNGLYTLNYINLGGFSTDGSLSGLAHTAPNFTNPPIDLYAYVNLFEQDTASLAIRRNTGITVRIDSVGGGVPEPSAWALMLMGFGGMGALLRRRRAGAEAIAEAGRLSARSSPR